MDGGRGRRRRRTITITIRIREKKTSSSSTTAPQPRPQPTTTTTTTTITTTTTRQREREKEGGGFGGGGGGARERERERLVYPSGYPSPSLCTLLRDNRSARTNSEPLHNDYMTTFSGIESDLAQSPRKGERARASASARERECESARENVWCARECVVLARMCGAPRVCGNQETNVANDSLEMERARARASAR